MSEVEPFEEDTFEEEEAALFAGEDDIEIPESKGPLVPRMIKVDFLEWLKDNYPHIRSDRDLTENNIMDYVQEFERDWGIRTTHKPDVWIESLRRRY
jgi:hypothetical protein